MTEGAFPYDIGAKDGPPIVLHIDGTYTGTAAEIRKWLDERAASYARVFPTQLAIVWMLYRLTLEEEAKSGPPAT